MGEFKAAFWWTAKPMEDGTQTENPFALMTEQENPK
jgi:hypothetical protein